jgi:hypothetical protein
MKGIELTDDLMLFGNLALFAIGAAAIAGAATGNWLLAIGVALFAFGILSALITFMAAGETE